VTTVRPGTGLDEDDAVAVWQAAQAERGRRSGGTRAQRTRAKLRAPDALLLVAVREDDVVGMLLAELARADDGAGRPVPGVLHLSMLFVAPAAQRTGVGRALLDALVARYPRVQVWADGEESGFFTAAGFAPTGRTQELAAGPVVQLSR
jgi:ribosomal protein S18 acetylase RimI-like enzyme